MRYRDRRPCRPWRGWVVKVRRRELLVLMYQVGRRDFDWIAWYPRRLLWDARPGERVSLLVTRRRTVLVRRTASAVLAAPVVDDGSWEVVL